MWFENNAKLMRYLTCENLNLVAKLRTINCSQKVEWHPLGTSQYGNCSRLEVIIILI